MKTDSERIKNKRLELGLSLAECEKISGINRKALWRYETQGWPRLGQPKMREFEENLDLLLGAKIPLDVRLITKVYDFSESDSQALYKGAIYENPILGMADGDLIEDNFYAYKVVGGGKYLIFRGILPLQN